MKFTWGDGEQRKKELNEEIASHLQMAARDREARGESPEQANEAARRELGNAGVVQDVTHDQWAWTWLEDLLQDVRRSLRTLRKSPGFTSIAVLTLALGIGANTTIFSMVDSFVLRPLPIKDPDQTAVFAFHKGNGPLQFFFSVPDYQEMGDQASASFSGLMCYLSGMDGLAVDGKSDRIMTNYVSGNYFSVLGLKPALGRLILPSEGETLGADPVMVLSYSYWHVHFGGDPNVVGRAVSVNGHPITIVGIAPAGFHGMSPFLSVQGFLPLGMASIGIYPKDFMVNRGERLVIVTGRLQPGITLQQAQSSLGVIGQRLSQTYPDTDKAMNIQAFPRLQAADPQHTTLVISGLFLGLAALVLLLACTNVANILLVRATAREREMAIRAALGAVRSRLIRQLLTESFVLAFLGGVAGLLLGYFGSSTLGSIHLQTDLPVQFDFGFDWRVFTYALVVALLTGVIVGIAPAIRSSSGLATVLREGGRGIAGGKYRLRRALAVAQVAGSLMLLIIAGLYARSLMEAQRIDLGFDPSHVLNLSMDPNQIGYSEAQGREFYRNLVDRVRALPGVESASIAAVVPLGYLSNVDTPVIDGYEPPTGQSVPPFLYNVISPDYFETMRIPMVRGRTFTSADDANTQYVGIVNEAMSKQFWPNQDPIGHHFKLGSEPVHTIEVVGVVKDSRFDSITSPIAPFFYLPFAQHYTFNSLETLQVRTYAAPGAMMPEIQRTIATLSPDLLVFDVETMRQGLYTLGGLLVFQIGAGLAASLGGLGLILAIVGVYGVVSFAASQRTHEIGIRMALGASPANVLKMVFRQGAMIVLVGLVIGLAAAFAAGRVARNFLVVSATDPVTYVTVSVLLATIALAACYIPARRATRVDPMVALRYE
jgi:predicted permease